MAGEVIASLSIFKTLLDMAKGLKDINDAAVRNAAVIELQEHTSPPKRSRRCLWSA